MKKLLHPCAFLLAAAVFTARADVTLFSTDFQNAALGSYADGSIINAGGAPHEQMQVYFGVTATHTGKVEVVQFDVDKKMLAVTIPETGHARYGRIFYTNKPFPDNPNPLSITAKGNHHIEGQFDIVFNSDKNTVEMDVIIGCQSDAAANAPIRFFMYNYGRIFYYQNGGRIEKTVPAIGVNEPYRVHFYGDMSNGLGGDFRWGFTVTRLSNNTPFWEVSDIVRSSASVPANIPDRFVMNAVYVNTLPADPTIPVLYFTNFHIVGKPTLRPTLFFLK